ncbi:Ig-like domain-containing protein [Mycolicibacterium fluoranthenivorans]|nr:Ig-like domain-containing protein [Mycolicibacterium fluoranthenivorans]
MSNGQGSPTRNLPSESGKGISYTPQETNLLNLQNAWGFPLSAVSAVSAKGGFTIRIPELPVRLQWRTVLIAQDYFNAKPIYLYWIANQAEVGDRSDQGVLDSNVIETTVSLDFQTDPAVGDPVIFGMCGEGIQDLAAAVADGSLYLPATGITTANLSVTAAAGVNHTKQVVVTDSQGIDRTATATFVSDTPAKATVNSAGLVTGVASGSANVTATWNGFTAVSVVTVT